MKRLLIASLFLFASSAQAGLLVEPYVGINLASGENGASPKTEYDQTAPFLGARLGYQTFGFMFGLDYTKGMEGDFETKFGSTTSTVDSAQSTMGAFIGYNLPVMFRVWGAYYFDTTLEQKSGTGTGDEISGSGLGLGAGFTGLPFVSVNIEYRMMTMDEFKDKATGVTSTLSGTSEIDYNQILLSVSLPLDL
ncbi:MAG: hypothetical protein CME71_11870 [Halobacteriovorax sp.]|nr:hypothetical protein [Halobacteriovorax sp.]